VSQRKRERVCVCVRARLYRAGKYNSGRFHLLLSSRGRRDRGPFSHDPGLAKESLYGNDSYASEKAGGATNGEPARDSYERNRGTALHPRSIQYGAAEIAAKLPDIHFGVASGRRLSESKRHANPQAAPSYNSRGTANRVTGCITLDFAATLPLPSATQASQTPGEAYRFDSSGLSYPSPSLRASIPEINARSPLFRVSFDNCVGVLRRAMNQAASRTVAL